MKLTDEEKLEIAKSIIECGCAVSEICSRYSLNKERMNLLVAKARRHGYESLGKDNRKYSYSMEFKLEVVRYALESHDSLRNVSIIYGINKGSARSWYAEYLELGDNVFMEEKRGRKISGSKPRGRRPKDADPDMELRREVEHLRKQNLRLKMENEYLKKLDALVQARIERESGKQSRNRRTKA